MSRLLDLPPEVRYCIYDYLTFETAHASQCSKDEQSCRHKCIHASLGSIRQTCKLTQAESLQLFLMLHRFTFSGAQQLAGYLRTSRPCKPLPIRHFVLAWPYGPAICHPCSIRNWSERHHLMDENSIDMVEEISLVNKTIEGVLGFAYSLETISFHFLMPCGYDARQPTSRTELCRILPANIVSFIHTWHRSSGGSGESAGVEYIIECKEQFPDDRTAVIVITRGSELVQDECELKLLSYWIEDEICGNHQTSLLKLRQRRPSRARWHTCLRIGVMPCVTLLVWVREIIVTSISHRHSLIENERVCRARASRLVEELEKDWKD